MPTFKSPAPRTGGMHVLVQIGGVELTAEAVALVEKVARFLAGFVLVYVVGRFAVRPALLRVMRGRGFDATVLSLGRNVINAAIYLVALGVGFAVAGFGSILTAVATFGSALALGVGFAAQELIGNFVAGVFILKDKPFEVGDWIEWNDRAGVVQEIDLRVTRVRTFDNEQITVPNGELANNAIKNPVAYQTLRQKFVFGIGYEDDIDHATDCIVEEAERMDDILDDPAPSVRVVELGDSAVGLQSRFWIDDPSRSDFVKTRSDYVRAVKNRFDAEGIDMPYVHRQLTGEVEVLESVMDDEARVAGDAE